MLLESHWNSSKEAELYIIKRLCYNGTNFLALIFKHCAQTLECRWRFPTVGNDCPHFATKERPSCWPCFPRRCCCNKPLVLKLLLQQSHGNLMSVCSCKCVFMALLLANDLPQPKRQGIFPAFDACVPIWDISSTLKGKQRPHMSQMNLYLACFTWWFARALKVLNSSLQ